MRIFACNNKYCRKGGGVENARPQASTVPSCTCSRKNSWISNGGGGGNKTICCSNFNMFRVFFCSVYLCVLLLAYTHISQTSCWYKSARTYTSVGARSGLTYFTRKISQYTTEKFAHDYVHLAKNFGGGCGFGKVATLRTFATFG